MYTLKDIKVEILNAEDIAKFIHNHGIFACVCYNTNEKYADKVGMSCLKEQHTSGSRADMIKFRITCPRYCADQIMRHSVGTAINCQSQRYVDMDENFSIYAPPEVLKDPVTEVLYKQYEGLCKDQYSQIREYMTEHGITGEKANDLMRTMLPIGVECNLTMGFTIEALIHFMHKRLCVRADAPIRRVAQLMKEEVLKIEPRYQEFFVPQCVNMMYCPEKHSCGAYPNKATLEELIEAGKKALENK